MGAYSGHYSKSIIGLLKRSLNHSFIYHSAQNGYHAGSPELYNLFYTFEIFAVENISYFNFAVAWAYKYFPIYGSYRIQ